MLYLIPFVFFNEKSDHEVKYHIHFWSNKYNHPEKWPIHKQNLNDLFLPELRQLFDLKRSFFIFGGFLQLVRPFIIISSHQFSGHFYFENPLKRISSDRF